MKQVIRQIILYLKQAFALVVILFLFELSSLHAGIQFRNVDIEGAIQIAQLEDKLIFIDTYASWCGPCKVMDAVFEEEKVSQYFNKEFVNIKIDMEGPEGQKMLHKYGVVWLPTLLILDQSGVVLSKIERLLSGSELISTASGSLSGSSSLSASQLNQNPFPSEPAKSRNGDFNPQSKEEVIYIYDKRVSSGRPHIMYHEAYLHLQLMDGKHQKVVKKYLSTQEDWSTAKNIKFIFDFLQDVNSEEFDYLINNKGEFEKLLGAERVKKTLSHLIHQRLEQGYPQPSIDEVIKLYSYIYEINVEQRAYDHCLSAFLNRGQDIEFINLSKSYLKTINPYDHEIIYQLVTLHLNRSNYKDMLDDDLELMLHAVTLQDDNPEYYFTLAKVFFYLEESKQALNSINKSIQLSEVNDARITAYKDLQKQILAL